MATRGVFQCKRLTLRYCEHGGSSRAVREYLASGRLLEWATERPSVEIKVRVANGKHPNLEASYLTKAVSNKTAMNGIQSRPVSHQVCLKSKGLAQNDEIEASDADAPWKHPVEQALDQLFNRSGRKITKFTKPVYTQTPSIQGVWTPSLDLHLEPEGFDLQIVEPKATSAVES